MIKYSQLITMSKRGDPHTLHPSKVGDCFRTAIACILEVPPQNLPHYTSTNWLQDWQDFLQQYGLALRHNSFQSKYYVGAGYAIASVRSLNYGKKVGHAVVTYHGKLVWDVSPLNKRKRLRNVSEYIYFEAIDPAKVHKLAELRK